ncbi:energy-coupling factor ABC transporter permease, partial [Salmonella enterica]|uniref:energy-coupling factor ABC transporter permease n=1 Tax=Salmonella enterica TaxID=28901 RepID=UPI00398C6F05
PVLVFRGWKMACLAGLGRVVAVFLCAMLVVLATYFVSSVQLGVAFPDPHAGATGSVVKFMGICCLTQIPVAIAGGLLTVMIYDQLTKREVITVRGH